MIRGDLHKALVGCRGEVGEIVSWGVGVLSKPPRFLDDDYIKLLFNSLLEKVFGNFLRCVCVNGEDFERFS